jgi:hypothetical protein
MRRFLKTMPMLICFGLLILSGCTNQSGQPKIDSSATDVTKETEYQVETNQYAREETPKEEIIESENIQSTELTGFNLEEYLESNFPIPDIRYEVAEVFYLEEYNRKNYVVSMIAETPEKDDFLIVQFKNESNTVLSLEEGTKDIFENAEKIINLPKELDFLHIQNVHWKSSNGEVLVVIIQDRDLNTIR